MFGYLKNVKNVKWNIKFKNYILLKNCKCNKMNK